MERRGLEQQGTVLSVYDIEFLADYHHNTASIHL
jgi:hypothetical protein